MSALDTVQRCWAGLVSGRSCGAPAASAVLDEIAQAYREPHRHYHTLDHIADLLTLLGRHGKGTADRDALELAILFHDIVYDPTTFIQQSVDAVMETILEAIFLVVIVVVLFLQTWRAAIIPIVAIPVSLIGTFFFMAMFGFTLNNLSLFGLVLAIGIVVDDAIVVVENVERNIAAGLAPREAAIKSMDEVGAALIAIALVLCAVFVPAAFITGISGQFYKQFALTIAGATVISLIVSLTLSPALCALLLKPHH